MKLHHLKEWGRSDLPGFGDQATFGGRSPDTENSQQSFDDYIKTEYTHVSELPEDAFPVPVGWLHLDFDEAEITKTLKKYGGLSVSNDTGHPFAQAFNHVIKPLWNFSCNSDEDQLILKSDENQLKAISASSGKQITITQLQAIVKKWMAVATKGPNTLADARSQFES